MNKLFLLLLPFWVFSCESPSGKADSGSEEATVVPYDSLLARQLGADDYGMKTYVMAFLQSGPERSQDSLEAATIQRAHLDYIKELATAKKLVLAGPFLDDGINRGIFLFDVPTLEEAEALTAKDPAIKSGRLVMELHLWYGSAAINLLNDWSRKIVKEEI